jgi:hypothetical protein
VSKPAWVGLLTQAALLNSTGHAASTEMDPCVRRKFALRQTTVGQQCHAIRRRT